MAGKPRIDNRNYENDAESLKRRIIKYEASLKIIKLRYTEEDFEKISAAIASYDVPTASLLKVALIEKLTRDGKLPEGFDANAEIARIEEAARVYMERHPDKAGNVGAEKS